ncbi:hypothetical protein HU200_009295 [Digitaria exilis]|uniref:Uncharacterized protein n=1 Tax=Digitaria exilis TaxID=1010633 RepID=A0A835KPG5_9POAL|nr:hypothetical protein HU200_009295 [Digitaria exilis]
MEASAAQTTIVDPASAIVEFNVNYEETKYLAAGKAVQSDAISACGLTWRINYYPNGFREGLKRASIDEYLFISLELLSKSSSVVAIFQVLLVDKDGQPVLFDASRASQFPTTMFRHMGRRTDLVQKYAKNGQIRFQCIIKASHDNSILVPPSDIVKHLGTLLDSADGKDVSFGVGDETFHAHRAVLAARSPVFKAELLGSMAEATMPSIALHDIAPATFKAMLRFMYTDALPGDDELIGDSPLEMFAPLLAAADRELDLGSHGPGELARAARPWHRRASAQQPCPIGAAMARVISSWASMARGSSSSPDVNPWRVPALDPPLGAALIAGLLRILRRRGGGDGKSARRATYGLAVLPIARFSSSRMEALARKVQAARRRADRMLFQERNLERQGKCLPRQIKRQRKSEAQEAAQTTTVDSAAVEFKLPCVQLKNVATGKAVHSDPISAGGQMWRINCTCVNESTGVYLAIFLELLSKSGSAKARFEAFLAGKDGEPSLVSVKRTGVHLFHRDNDQFGWPQFVKIMDLATDFVRDGVITFLCSIMVWHHSGGIPVPPSDIGENLGMLLDSTDGADVSFAIDGETFHVHRAVLAARCPLTGL